MMIKKELNKGSEYMQFVTSLHSTLVDQQIMLVYEGEINQDITKIFTAITEKNMDTPEFSGKTSRRVYHVMVELLQNICKHSDAPLPKEKNIGAGMFMVGFDDDNFYVTTGNVIESSKLPSLLPNIDEYNGMDPDELKVKYKEMIKASRISDVGGAGLGIIDIVKKTGNKLQYDVIEKDENYSFLVQLSTISK